ncbi:MAG TPA: hypothetical protein VJ837_02055, partial [Candidatus Paceibacterota bacterium]|nr:hypothetical protein [Candidatus Paceibacterota bacterium]
TSAARSEARRSLRVPLSYLLAHDVRHRDSFHRWMSMESYRHSSTFVGIVYLTQGHLGLIILLSGLFIGFLDFLLGPRNGTFWKQPLHRFLSC